MVSTDIQAVFGYAPESDERIGSQQYAETANDAKCKGEFREIREIA